MRTIFSNNDDFKEEKVAIQHYVKTKDIRHFFSSVNLTLSHESGDTLSATVELTLVKLQQLINPALDSSSNQKFFQKGRDYEKAYAEGLKAGRKVKETVKKSHRIF